MSPLAEHDVVWAYQKYFPVLRQKCRRMLSDPAEAMDVAQETFTRLWSRRMDLDNAKVVAGWLYTTSTRLAVDRLRARRPETDVDALPAAMAGVPERVVHARRELTRVARSLTAEQLEILVLWRIDGLEQTEIAELLGLGERTVRRRIRAAEARLSRLGADHGK
ncbi:MAG: sigma-70 family RNA polymerase sigma factor [Myxococcota bacterium]